MTTEHGKQRTRMHVDRLNARLSAVTTERDALRADIEAVKAALTSPYAWAVSGLGMPFYGEHAEADARNEARRVGGDARVFPLYKGL